MENRLRNERYTDKTYWEIYHKRNEINVESIKKIVGNYNFYWDKLIGSCKHKPKTILEIGAYPGRYLAYLSEKYDLIPASLDFNSDKKKIEDSFKAFNIKEYSIIQADFMEHQPDMKFDLVISNGFIEHFENFEEIMDKHCVYLAPGGALLIMVPNKRYLRKWYGRLVDNKNLKHHNLSVMDLNVFEKFAERNHLKIELLKYFGGFPYSVHQKLNFIQSGIYQLFRRVFKVVNPIIEKNPNRFLSSKIVAIYSHK